MRNSGQRNQRRHTDLRTLDNHESWRDVYGLLEVEPSIDPTTTSDDEQRAGTDDDTAATALEVRA